MVTQSQSNGPERHDLTGGKKCKTDLNKPKKKLKGGEIKKEKREKGPIV